MTQQPMAEDYVLATGETRTIREFVGFAADAAGIRVEWRGKGVDETGVDASSGRPLVRVNPAFFRLTDVDVLVGKADARRVRDGFVPFRTEDSLAELPLVR